MEQALLRTDFPDLPVEETSLMVEEHQGGMEGHTPLDGTLLPIELVETDSSSCTKETGCGGKRCIIRDADSWVCGDFKNCLLTSLSGEKVADIMKTPIQTSDEFRRKICGHDMH